jgi:hypothetical protein
MIMYNKTMREMVDIICATSSPHETILDLNSARECILCTSKTAEFLVQWLGTVPAPSVVIIHAPMNGDLRTADGPPLLTTFSTLIDIPKAGEHSYPNMHAGWRDVLMIIGLFDQ